MDLASFRIRFPQFAALTDDELNAAADDAACFVSACTCSCSELALQLMVAHLLTLSAQATSGGGGAGPVSSATVGKVTVAFALPTSQNEWSAWLGQSPYGRQLAALLSRRAIGGAYVGGSPVRRAFRGYR